jgi:L,D-transpeptidase-like protein
LRRPGAVLAVFCTVLALISFPRAADADSSGPAAPTALAMTFAGAAKQVAAGSWLNVTKLDLHVQVTVSGGKVTPEVEVEPAGTAFTNKPNYQGQPLSSSGVATVLVQNLQDGKTFHWQARVTDTTGASSDWVSYAAQGASGPDFGIDLDAPSAPTIVSPTNPSQGRWYHNRVVTVQWSSTDRLSGLQGYSFVLGRNPRLAPPGTLTAATGARVSNMADGIWYLAVRAEDKAGNWSSVSRFRMQLDRQVPQVSWLSPSRFNFNPYEGPASLKFQVSKDSSVSLALYRVGSKTPTATFWYPHLRAHSVTTLVWSGKNKLGQPVAQGYYFFSVQARDRAGNIVHTNLGGITLRADRPQTVVGGVVLYPDGGRKIVVVLSQETLYAYDGTHLVLKTFVTTGNPALPTPTGTYQVMAKYHPYEMVSPWPPGSPYYYAPSWMQYAMLFRDGGYFIHDAPWRSAFGPGTNGPGQPGTNYGGTHGCVNVPPSPMTFLFGWASVGTPVYVVN